MREKGGERGRGKDPRRWGKFATHVGGGSSGEGGRGRGISRICIVLVALLGLYLLANFGSLVASLWSRSSFWPKGGQGRGERGQGVGLGKVGCPGRNGS